MSFLENMDKNRLQKVLLVVISALLLAALVCLVVIIISSLGPTTPVTQGFDVVDLTLKDKDVSTGTLVLADKTHLYDENNALDLVECQTYRDEQMVLDGITDKPYLPYKGMKLTKEAMKAAHNMLSDAKKNIGSAAITIDAAFGRIAYGGDDAEGYKTGLLMFLSDNTSDSGAYVKLANEYSHWLKTNAAKYGFINAFDDAYRYVGIVHATYMSEEELSLADYIEYLKKNTDSSKALTVKVGDTTYSVYYAKGGEGETVKVPAKGEYTISGTNEGGVIITLKNAK